jgi:opacity protein-like surface antigen
MLSASRVLVLSLIACLAVVPTRATAEPFVDAFAGIVFTPKNDLDFRLDGVRTDTTSEFKDSFSVGGRAGYWFSFFGINLDLSYFRPELDPDDFTLAGTRVETDLDVIGVGVNAMLRGQFLKSPNVPQGRLQPYIFAGPTVFFSRFEVDLSGAASGDESDVSTKLGMTAGGGLTYMFTRLFGVFAEYRFTYNRPEFNLDGLRVKPDLDSHHVLGGLTLRF